MRFQINVWVVLSIILVVLKLTDVVDWSWLVVLAPLYISYFIRIFCYVGLKLLGD